MVFMAGDEYMLSGHEIGAVAGVPVLVRNGFGEERKSYALTYRSMREAVRAELPANCSMLQRAQLLLRRRAISLNV